MKNFVWTKYDIDTHYEQDLGNARVAYEPGRQQANRTQPANENRQSQQTAQKAQTEQGNTEQTGHGPPTRQGHSK